MNYPNKKEKDLILHAGEMLKTYVSMDEVKCAQVMESIFERLGIVYNHESDEKMVDIKKNKIFTKRIEREYMNEFMINGKTFAVSSLEDDCSVYSGKDLLPFIIIFSDGMIINAFMTEKEVKKLENSKHLEEIK